MTVTSERLDELEQALEAAAAKRDAAAVAVGWRAVLEYLTQVGADRPDPEPMQDEVEYTRLWKLAQLAMANLGGQAVPPVVTLADYDSERYGPILGVSDEGSATAAIRRGALAAPKYAALTERTPFTIGIAHDAERLGAVGEVAVGPDEFATIRLAARGRVLTTTNVGTRVNLRSFLNVPAVRVGGIDWAIDRLKQLFEPFVKTVSGRPRALTVLVDFDPKIPLKSRRAMLARLNKAVEAGTFSKPKWHGLGLLIDPGLSKERVARARAGIDLATSARVEDAALVGLDDDRFEPEELDELLKHAATKKVRLGPRAPVDPQTTARHVWTGLAMARNMGLELGKYGLVPLTFEDQKQVIARIQYWFPYWCAAPVFYLDYPLATEKEVYYGPRLAAGIRRWLEMVAKLGVRIVLIDTAKKSEGRRLFKDSAKDDRGFLSLDEIGDLTAFAVGLKVKVLWAGGVTMPLAYALGRLGVFGMYVTTAAATLEPLDRRARNDPFLVGLREPRETAVARVKFLIETGFLIGRGTTELEADVTAMLAAHATGNEAETARLQAKLFPRVVAAWRKHLAT